MENKLNEVKGLIQHLQLGYDAGRQTVGNEKLAFLTVMLAVTKRSVPQVMAIRRNQFLCGKGQCIFRGLSPRLKNVYRINLPISFMEYLNGYCSRYLIARDEALFSFNSEYVCNRIRELIKIQGYGISVTDIQKLIPYSYNTERYQKLAYELIGLLQNSVTFEMYKCTTAEKICESIEKFESKLM